LFQQNPKMIGWIRLEPNYGYVLYNNRSHTKTIIIRLVRGTRITESINEDPIQCSIESQLYFKFLNKEYYMENILWK